MLDHWLWKLNCNYKWILVFLFVQFRLFRLEVFKVMKPMSSSWFSLIRYHFLCFLKILVEIFVCECVFEFCSMWVLFFIGKSSSAFSIRGDSYSTWWKCAWHSLYVFAGWWTLFADISLCLSVNLFSLLRLNLVYLLVKVVNTLFYICLC